MLLKGQFPGRAPLKHLGRVKGNLGDQGEQWLEKVTQAAVHFFFFFGFNMGSLRRSSKSRENLLRSKPAARERLRVA